MSPRHYFGPQSCDVSVCSVSRHWWPRCLPFPSVGLIVRECLVPICCWHLSQAYGSARKIEGCESRSLKGPEIDFEVLINCFAMDTAV